MPPGRPATPAPEFCVLGPTGDCGGVGCARAGSAKSARLKTRELVFALILALPVNGAGRTRPHQHQFRPRIPPNCLAQPAAVNVTAAATHAQQGVARAGPAMVPTCSPTGLRRRPRGCRRTMARNHPWPCATQWPTWDDRLIASAFGGHAVDLVARGKFDRMLPAKTAIP